jgi:uncharacterized protein
MRLAIVGSGISGLAAAHALRGQADISLFEAGDYFGGHTHTVDVRLPGAAQPFGVDTGFLVFNERTYPELIQLLADLGVPSAKSEMSFSVQIPQSSTQATSGQVGLEWSGTSLSTVFAQRRNLLNPRFLRMLADLLRFNALCSRLALQPQEDTLAQPLGDFLRAHRFSNAFRDWYFLPMMGCIWSCPTDQMLQFPVATMIRFCHNHGLLQVSNRPQWWTVQGGARQYVDKIVARIGDKRLNTPVRCIERDTTGVSVLTDGGAERFDKVILATHSDQALRLLHQPSPQEAATLGAIRYQSNRAVLHTDTSVLPSNRSAWAAWNYERASSAHAESARVCLHYLINLLQPLPVKQPVLVSLNPIKAIDPQHVLQTFDYAHPVFDLAAIRAQAFVPALQGQQHTYFAGAWMGYGFHEDGLKAGLGVAARLQAHLQIQFQAHVKSFPPVSRDVEAVCA